MSEEDIVPEGQFPHFYFSDLEEAFSALKS